AGFDFEEYHTFKIVIVRRTSPQQDPRAECEGLRSGQVQYPCLLHSSHNQALIGAGPNVSQSLYATIEKRCREHLGYLDPKWNRRSSVVEVNPAVPSTLEPPNSLLI